MRKLTSVLLSSAIALALMAGAAQARGGSDWRDCNGRDLDARISACSRIIDETGSRQNSTMRAGALNNRAIAYFAKGEFDRAIRDFDEAIAAKPNNPVLYHNRGMMMKGAANTRNGTAANAFGTTPSLSRPKPAGRRLAAARRHRARHHDDEGRGEHQERHGGKSLRRDALVEQAKAGGSPRQGLVAAGERTGKGKADGEREKGIQRFRRHQRNSLLLRESCACVAKTGIARHTILN